MVADVTAEHPPGELRAAGTYGPRIRLRDTLIITVDNLAALLTELDCARQRDSKKHEIILYLDGRPLRDLVAYPPSDPQLNVLKFELKRSETSRDVWKHILGKATLRERKTLVSVGIDDGFAIEPGVTVGLVVLPPGWLTFWSLLFIALLIGFLWLARRSDVLRDTSRTSAPGVPRLFSLARAQAAWWFFLILAAYLFIGLVTGDYSTSITGTVLVLFGISAGTTVASAFVDESKTTPESERERLARITAAEGELAVIERDIEQARADLGAAADVTAKAVANKLLAERTAAWAIKSEHLRTLRFESEGFLRDILSDANGVNFHRFQIAAWTVVLGIIFIVEVYRELAMPQFGETLLALMGISSGTYVGLKIPEATTPPKT